MKNLENKENLFTSDDIRVKCPKDMRWENMQEVKDGRFCDGCHEKLYYVGGYTKGEVKTLQRKYGSNIFVAVRPIVTSSLAFGLSACSGKEVKSKKMESRIENSIVQHPVVVGVPILEPILEPK
jgi:hypothetical protein